MNPETVVTMHLWSFNQVFFAVYIYNCFHNANLCAQSMFPCYRNWCRFPFLQTEVQQQLMERDTETNRLQREVRELRVRNDADCKHTASATFIRVKILYLPSSASGTDGMHISVDSN